MMSIKSAITISEHAMRRSFSEAFELAVSTQKRYIRKNGTVNQSAIARDLGVTSSTVNRMITNRSYNPSEKLLNTIAATLNVSINAVCGNEYFPWEEEETRKRNRPDLNNLPIVAINVFKLDELNNYKNVFSASHDVAHSREFVMPRSDANSESMIVIEIDDESMCDLLQKGDYVLVDLDGKPSIGKKVLAVVEAEKYVIRTLGEQNMLFAENQIYAPREAIRVIGVCLERIKRDPL